MRLQMILKIGTLGDMFQHRKKLKLVWVAITLFATVAMVAMLILPALS